MNFNIVPFDKGFDHRAFIEDTFLRCARDGWPWSLIDYTGLRRDFQARIRRPEARVAVAVSTEDPTAYLGWAAACPMFNEIIFAYTVSEHRTKGKFRPNVASTLLATLGVDLAAGATLRYWTPTAEVLRARGYKIEPVRTM